jgi:XRE family aerobic/anaerobic benzoate catabolism transcriptional regulator
MSQLHRQAYYRRVEPQVLQSLLQKGTSLVLSTGGGLVTESRTFALLQRYAHTVWLRARPEDHWERVLAQGDTRPMAGNEEAYSHMCAILTERERLYEQAQIMVDTSRSTLDQVCDDLAQRFAALAG